MAALLNAVQFLATTNSTGDFAVSAAANGFLAPIAGGAVNNATYTYRAENSSLTEWEVGQGVWTNATNVIARTTIVASSAGGGSKTNFSVPPTVSFTAVVSDLVPGSNTQVIFNDSGQANASSILTINKTTTAVKITGVIDAAAANVLSQTITQTTNTISWNVGAGVIANVTINTANVVFAAPTSLKIGTYFLYVIQDGSGNRGTTTTWNAVFKWPGGTPPVWSTTAGRVDLCTFISNGTNLYGSYILDVR